VTVSTHVLDATAGLPAAGVHIRLERMDSPSAWTQLAGGRTDADGRLREWTPPAGEGRGVHRLVFETGPWFAGRGVPTFFPEVVVVFEVTDPAAHHHVPLLLSPYAYATYRGT
jgi:5-hydroxyisourate hydrolase